jgi:hypothetical protein
MRSAYFHRVGNHRAAEAAIDRLRAELGKRLRQVPAHDAGRAGEDDGIGRRQSDFVLRLELGNGRLPAIGRGCGTRRGTGNLLGRRAVNADSET